MVVFTCNGCGKSLKKKVVADHISYCKFSNLTCIDCLQDFDHKSYNLHFVCKNEAERYGGLNYEKKPNKGQVKQELWIQNLQEVIDSKNYPKRLEPFLLSIQKFPNIPRKRYKFENFVKSQMRNVPPNAIGDLWQIFEQALKKPEETKLNVDEKQNEDKVEEKICTDENVKDDKNTKRKLKENDQNENKKQKFDSNKNTDDIKDNEPIDELEENQVYDKKSCVEKNGELIFAKKLSDGSLKIKYKKWLKNFFFEKKVDRYPKKKFFKEVTNWYKSINDETISKEDFKNNVIKLIVESNKYELDGNEVLCKIQQEN